MVRIVSFILRRWVRFLVAGGITVAALVAGTNYWVISQSRERIISDPERLPREDVGLVLGTSPIRRSGQPNPFFEGRMNAAAQLYRMGKVRHLLLSGDNGKREYDEPSAMRDALLKRGIPASAMTLDYAGFRTLDSIVRAKAIFGVSRTIIITDDFHESRSLFLAQAYGIDAVGFSSERVPLGDSKKTRVRELASRFVACLDVYLLKTKPRYFGKQEPIVIAQSGE